MALIPAPQRRRCVTAGTALALLVCTTSFSAAAADGLQSSPFLERSFYLAAGGFFPRVDSTVRLGPRLGGRGTTIDFEDTLGLEDSPNSLWVQARWRFGDRHRVEFEWFELDRNAERNVDRQLTVRDVSAGVGADLNTHFRVSLARLTYGWSFLKDDTKEVSLLVGTHVARMDANIELSGNISDLQTGASLGGTTVQENGEVTAPLPHIGLGASYAFSPRLFFDASVIGFALNVQEIKGSLIEVVANFQYLFTDNVAVGGGVRYFDVSVEKDRQDGQDEFNFDFFGPVLFLAGSF